MSTLADRLREIRQARAAAEADAVTQQEAASHSNWDVTVDQLRRLIRAEIDITDDLSEAKEIHQPYSYGTPEGLFAVIQLADVWFGLPVTASAGDDTRLLAMVHCPNGHVLHMEYPHSGDDSWDQALLRTQDAQEIYADTSNCPQCVTYRTTARDYQPRIG